MRLEELIIPLNVDKGGFTGGMNSATKMITDFAKVAAVAVAAAAVVVGKFLVDSTKLASDLAETVSKTSIVFGDSANDLMDWAKTSATAMGMSKNSALAAAATYGNLFRAMGITEKASATMSKKLVILAGDLASFNNMNPTEVLDKLRAGLSGETEPLRTLGVNLNQALIEERALELGLWDGVDAIDAAAKAQASYSLILEQTTLAQGDFARTADGLANQQRILAAQWEDLKTTLGTAFLPTFTRVVAKFNEFVKILADPAGIDGGKIVAWADNAIGSFTKGLGDSINNWVSSGGPEALTESLVSWIEGIGDSDAVKSKTQIAMEHLVAAMGNALREVDWSAVQAAMGEKIQELFAANQPVGENSVRDFWNGLEVAGTDAVRNWFNSLESPAQIASKSFFAELGAKSAQDVRQWGLSLANGFGETFSGFVSKMNELEVRISDRLRDIAKTFFNRAVAWASQMIAGFVGSQGGLFSSISNMVGEINSILRKIITSFHLTLTFSEPVAGSGSMGGGTGGGGGGTTGGGGNRRRASGGPVIAGQSYSVAEFFRPERFTPNTNGRIDPMQSQTVTATIDEGRLARLIVQALMQAQGGG